jgi:hypothetical protein
MTYTEFKTALGAAQISTATMCASSLHAPLPRNAVPSLRHL